MRSGRRSGRLHPLHLAGWLFADVLLVLALIAMGDQGDPAAARQPAPGASSPGAESPKPSPSPSGPRAVERKPVKIALEADSSDRTRIVQQLRKATAKYEGRQAAIVLTFGHHQDAGAGVAYAGRINSLLGEARPRMFRGATTRDFVLLRGGGGRADLEIYFYTY
ncbi:hypothetical protein [Streptomyces sp. CMB-StM0423]|uniref:hypothetical protein n=1 Tax=Streptomyces sp. CMB-StM0423 TaxID=2059884 RepID=UPI000C703960|nr:hypothetical protein [Streptomyces sp. CMB-StM0423]AUH42078.1 hypothetical protein CXR04_19390 [Streptomyces sp. CMB-StM0423]